MRVLVTDLTRMGHPRICVAGLDMATGEHIRPVRTASDPLTLDDTRPHGGVFELGGTVELGDVTRCGVRPEVEDCRFARGSARFLELASSDEVYDLLAAVAKPTLEEIFGSSLREQGRTYSVDLGTGDASLGCLRVEQPVRLFKDTYGNRQTLRLAVQLRGRDCRIAVTDLRFFSRDFSQPDDAVVGFWDQQLRRADEVLLAVGLTRPFAREGDVERHWLQVNTIYCR